MRRIRVRVLLVVAAGSLTLCGLLVGGHSLQQKRVSERALVAGRAALDRQDWGSACRELKTYLLRHPDDFDLLVRYAEANLAVRPSGPDRIGAAVGAYLRALGVRPGDEEVCKRLVHLHFAMRDHAQAVEICRRRLAVASDDGTAAAWLGRALAGLGKADEARDALQAFIGDHPQQLEPYWQLSEILAESNPDAALDCLDRAAASNPESVEARARRARFYLRVKQDVAAARSDLAVADSMHSRELRTLLLLAEAWLDLGEVQRAADELEAIHGLDPKLLTEHDVDLGKLQLGLLMAESSLALQRGEKEKARTLADKGLGELSGERRSTFLPVVVRLLLACGDIIRAQQCCDEYEQAIRGALQPERQLSSQLVLMRSAVEGARGNWHRVINLLEPLMVTESARGLAVQQASHVQVYRLLAQAYSRTDQPRRAQQALEKYVLLSPGDWEATRQLAQFCFRQGDDGRARKYAEDAVRIRPDDLESKLLAIKTSLRRLAEAPTQTRPAAPLAELDVLKGMHPRNAEIRLISARLLIGQGRRAEAVAELERAVGECEPWWPLDLQLIDMLAADGQRDRAVAACQRAIDRFASQAEPPVALADVLARARRTSDEIETLNTAVGRLTGDEQTTVRCALARHLFAHDRRAEGIAVLQQAAAAQPENMRCRLMLLSLPEIQADSAACQKRVDELKSIEGDRGQQWRLAQAELWLRQGDWRGRLESAVRLLQECMQMDEGWAAPVVVLGGLYERLEQDDKAEELYRTFFDNHSGEMSVVMRLYELLERQRRFVAAGKILDRVPAGLSAISAFRIRSAIGRGDYEAAITELRERVGSDAADAVARVMLARLIYHQSHDDTQALKLLDEAATIDPNLMLISVTRVTILHERNRDADATAFLDAEVARRHDFETRLLRADYRVQMGQVDLAEQDYLHLTTTPPQPPDAWLYLGRFYDRMGRHVQAIDTFEAGAKLWPEYLPLRRALLQAMIASDDPGVRERGRRQLAQGLASRPADSGLLSIQASDLLAQSRPADDAELNRILERIVEINPRDVVTHLHLIERARRWGNLPWARDLADRALGANPESPELLALKANLERRVDNLRIARRLAASVLRLDRDNLPARCLLVYLALQDNNIVEARKYSDEALAIKADNEEVQFTHALVLNADGQRRKAIESLERWRLTPAGAQSVSALLLLADLYRFEKDLDAAQQRLDVAEQLDANDTSVFLAQLRMLGTRKRYDQVLVRLAERRASRPDEPEVLLGAAGIMAYAGADHYLREARAIYEQFAERYPDRVEGFAGLGQVQYQLHDTKAAIQAYRQVLQIDAYHQQALNNLAYLLAESGDEAELPEALELAHRGVLRYPQDANMLDTQAGILLRLHRPTEAQVDLTRCLAASTLSSADRARALLKLARAEVLLNHGGAAARAISAARELDSAEALFTAAERNELNATLAATTTMPNSP